MSRIAIGSAQFGMRYGITNTRGQVCQDNVSRILELGLARGCRWIDTASAYGNAEALLGKTPETRDFHISTKVGSQPSPSIADLDREFSTSLQRLRRPQVDTLLLHRSDWLQHSRREVLEWANSLRERGQIRAFGISVYSPAEIEAVNLEHLDWIQLPCSVLAQEWHRNGHIDRLRNAGVRIQVRSVLAQGLVAADPERLPPPLAALREPLQHLQVSAQRAGTSALHLALAYVLQLPIDLVVMGFESPEQLKHVLDCEPLSIDLQWKEFACDDLPQLDPRNWPRGIQAAR